MEIAQQRLALRNNHHYEPPSPSPAQHMLSSSQAQGQAQGQPFSVDGGQGLGSGEGMGDDYVVDIYCRDAMEVSDMGYTDAAADGQGLGTGLGVEPGTGLGQRSGLGRGGPGSWLSGDDLVHLSATATVVQVQRLNTHFPLHITPPITHTHTHTLSTLCHYSFSPFPFLRLTVCTSTV